MRYDPHALPTVRMILPVAADQILVCSLPSRLEARPPSLCSAVPTWPLARSQTDPATRSHLLVHPMLRRVLSAAAQQFVSCPGSSRLEGLPWSLRPAVPQGQFA